MQISEVFFRDLHHIKPKEKEKRKTKEKRTKSDLITYITCKLTRTKFRERNEPACCCIC